MKTFFLEMQSPPVLYLDLSDKQKEDSAINSNMLLELSKQINELTKKNRILEETVKNLSDEVKLNFIFLRIQKLNKKIIIFLKKLA